MLGLPQYDSDEDPLNSAAAERQGGAPQVVSCDPAEGSDESDSEEVETLARRFLCKHLAVIRDTFRCTLCAETPGFAKRVDCEEHVRCGHAVEFYEFRQEHRKRNPDSQKKKKKAKEESAAKRKKVDFSIEAVLGKKLEELAPEKEKVAVGPDFEQLRQSGEDELKNIDFHKLTEEVLASVKQKFMDESCLRVERSMIRCTLCRAGFRNRAECEAHVDAAHQRELNKELQSWQRFVLTNSDAESNKCSICGRVFGTYQQIHHHIGLQVWRFNEKNHRERYAVKLWQIMRSEEDACQEGTGLVSDSDDGLEDSD